MTLAQPYNYWTRATSYDNTWGVSNPTLFNRSQSYRSPQDLHVRTYLRTRVAMYTPATSAPPQDWVTGMFLVGVAQWTPQPDALIADFNSNDPGIVATSWLTPRIYPAVAAGGPYTVIWEQTETVSSRVYRAAPPDNSDYPAVQSGVHLFDLDGVFYPPNGYSTRFRAFQFLETLWASSQPS